MFIRSLILFALGLLLASSLSAQTPLSPAFTYQGRLAQNGQPYNGPANLGFALYDSSSGGNSIGIIQAFSGVPVVNGLFAVVLNANNEFGANPFNGEKRWLQIAVNGTLL